MKHRVATEAKGRELMDFAAENEATLGGGLQRGAEGARLQLESGAGEAGKGLTGVEKIGDREEGGAPRAEEMRVFPTAVKLEESDWSEVEEGVPAGRWIKQEVEDGPEVKEEKPDPWEVKQEVEGGWVVKEEKVEIKEEKVEVKEEVVDWPEVKEERKDDLEIKQEEMLFARNIKEEVMDEVCVKEEKYFPKEEILDDIKVKEEPPVDCPVGSKRKLAMSR